MSSYSLSERIDVHAILFYGLALPAYRAATAIDKGLTAIRAALPHLLFALIVLAKALGLVAVVAGGAFLAFTFWVALVQTAFALAIIAAFAYATYPRTAVSSHE